MSSFRGRLFCSCCGPSTHSRTESGSSPDDNQNGCGELIELDGNQIDGSDSESLHSLHSSEEGKNSSDTSSIHKSEVNLKDVSVDPFCGLLFDIAEEITEDEFKKMKYLSPGIPKSKIGKMKTPQDLFDFLCSSGKLEKNNTKLLCQLLDKIHRRDLVDLVNFEFPFSKNNESVVKNTENIVELLRDWYLRRIAEIHPLPWWEECSLDLRKVYTNLQIMSKDKRGKLIPGKTVNEQNIFDNLESSKLPPNRILVEGEPAIGKSTFCRKVVLDWAEGKLSQFKFVFLLELRHFQGNGTVSSIFEQLFPEDVSISRDELKQCLSCNSDKTLFILDGYDELNPNLELTSDVLKVLNGKLYRKSTILLTSRPYSCNLSMEARFLVKGYFRVDSLSFMTKFFKDSEIAYQLMTKIDDRQALQDIIRNPLCTFLLCILWEENSSLPDLLTDIYQAIVHIILNRYCEKKNLTYIESSEIPVHLKSDVEYLGELAWKGLLEDKLYFLESEIMNKVLLILGFLTKDTSFSQLQMRQIVYFPHKTFQEFFAAFFLSFVYLSDDILKKLVLEEKFSQVCLFLAGVLKSSSKPLFNYFAKALANEDVDIDEKYLDLCFRCLYEANSEILLPIVSPAMPPEVDCDWLSSNESCIVLTRLLLFQKNSRETTGLINSLKNANKLQEEYKSLSNLLCDNQFIKSIHLNISLEKFHKDFLSNLISNFDIEILDLEVNIDEEVHDNSLLGLIECLSLLLSNKADSFRKLYLFIHSTELYILPDENETEYYIKTYPLVSSLSSIFIHIGDDLLDHSMLKQDFISPLGEFICKLFQNTNYLVQIRLTLYRNIFLPGLLEDIVKIGVSSQQLTRLILDFSIDKKSIISILENGRLTHLGLFLDPQEWDSDVCLALIRNHTIEWLKLVLPGTLVEYRPTLLKEIISALCKNCTLSEFVCDIKYDYNEYTEKISNEIVILLIDLLHSTNLRILRLSCLAYRLMVNFSYTLPTLITLLEALRKDCNLEECHFPSTNVKHSWRDRDKIGIIEDINKYYKNCIQYNKLASHSMPVVPRITWAKLPTEPNQLHLP